MIRKCFLSINDYPRNVGDIPFSITIDWGDGSDEEVYADLRTEKVPQLAHVYKDEESEEYEITVTIENTCGSESQTVLYKPYVLPECTPSCMNTFEDFNPSEAVTSFEGVGWNLEMTSCFTEIERLDNGNISMKLCTDAAVDVPLIAFPPLKAELPEGVFALKTPVGDWRTIPDIQVLVFPEIAASGEVRYWHLHEPANGVVYVPSIDEAEPLFFYDCITAERELVFEEEPGWGEGTVLTCLMQYDPVQQRVTFTTSDLPDKEVRAGQYEYKYEPPNALPVTPAGEPMEIPFDYPNFGY